MPHDVNGTELKEGDEVVIRYIVKQITRGIEYCNCQLESVHGRKPDGMAEYFSGNIGVCEKVGQTPSGETKLNDLVAKNAIKYPEPVAV